jgi:hypothetical protein
MAVWIGPVVLVLFFGLAFYMNVRMIRWRRGSQPVLRPRARSLEWPDPTSGGVDYAAHRTRKAASQSALGRPPTARLSFGVYCGTTLAAAFALALLGFWIGATDLQRYSVGTPTRATVTYCGVGSRSNCEATWTIGGVSQTGVINGGFWDGADRVGSSLDVRVSNGEAFTPRSVPVGFALGGGSLLVALCALILLIRRRSRTRRESRSAAGEGFPGTG